MQDQKYTASLGRGSFFDPTAFIRPYALLFFLRRSGALRCLVFHPWILRPSLDDVQSGIISSLDYLQLFGITSHNLNFDVVKVKHLA